MVDITVSGSEGIMSINGVLKYRSSLKYHWWPFVVLTKWQCCKCDMVVATLSYHYSIGSFHPDNATVNTIPCDDYASV